MKKFFNTFLVVLLAVTAALLVWVLATQSSIDEVNWTGNTALNAMFFWTYFLFAAALLTAVGCAVFGMTQSSGGHKSTVISVVVIAVVIAGAIFLAMSHHVLIPDIANASYFDRTETIITDASILVTYVAAAAALLTAAYTAVADAIK